MTLRILSGEAAQRFALPALGRAAERRPTGKRIRRRKMLEIAPESPASGARFVSHLFAFQIQTLLFHHRKNNFHNTRFHAVQETAQNQCKPSHNADIEKNFYI